MIVIKMSARRRLPAFMSLLKLEDQLDLAISIISAAMIAVSSFFVPDTLQLLLALLFGFSLLSCYIILNQYYEVKVDAINKPERLLPSRAISKKTALYLAISFLVIGLLAAVLLGPKFILIALATLIIGVSYSLPALHIREKMLISIMFLTIGYAIFSFLTGWLLFSSIALIPWVWILFLLCTDIPATFVKDYKDTMGDKSYGIKTLPVVLGHRRAVHVNMLLYFLPFLVMAIAAISGFISINFLVLPLVCITTSLLVFHRLLKKNLEIDDINKAYKIMTLNIMLTRVLGTWAFIAVHEG